MLVGQRVSKTESATRLPGRTVLRPPHHGGFSGACSRPSTLILRWRELRLGPTSTLPGASVAAAPLAVCGPPPRDQPSRR